MDKKESLLLYSYFTNEIGEDDFVEKLISQKTYHGGNWMPYVKKKIAKGRLEIMYSGQIDDCNGSGFAFDERFENYFNDFKKEAQRKLIESHWIYFFMLANPTDDDLKHLFETHRTNLKIFIKRFEKKHITPYVINELKTKNSYFRMISKRLIDDELYRWFAENKIHLMYQFSASRNTRLMTKEQKMIMAEHFGLNVFKYLLDDDIRDYVKLKFG